MPIFGKAEFLIWYLSLFVNKFSVIKKLEELNDIVLSQTVIQITKLNAQKKMNW